MRGRFPAMAAMRGMTPFVGREDELRSLLNRWERVREGEGQVVTIIGEAGIGKSRLVQRFREELAATPYTWLECATAPFFQNTPFYAVADMLQQSFHWEAQPHRGTTAGRFGSVARTGRARPGRGRAVDRAAVGSAGWHPLSAALDGAGTAAQTTARHGGSVGLRPPPRLNPW